MNPSPVEERGGRVILRVRAVPKAAKEGLQGLHGDALKVAVRAPPEDGKANAALCKVIAREFGLRPAQVSLHSGATSRNKCFRLEGLRRAGVEEKLLVLLRADD